jgi:hypothetical protein
MMHGSGEYQVSEPLTHPDHPTSKMGIIPVEIT